MKTVVALFDSLDAADAARTALIRSGVAADCISAVAKHDVDPAQEEADVAEGASIGAAVGGSAGATVGLLASLGLLVIPGMGPFLAAGAIVTTLVGASAGAAAGGLIGGFMGLGIPAHEAEVYAEGIHRGHTLLSVTTADTHASEIADMLTQYGAVDLIERAGQWEADGWKRKHPVPATSVKTHQTIDPQAAAKARDVRALETGNINSNEPYPADRGIDLGAVSSAGSDIGSIGTGMTEGIADTGRRRTARIY